MRTLAPALALAFALSSGACGKSSGDDPSAPAAATAAAPPAAGAGATAAAPAARAVPITVDHKGYTPAAIDAVAGERLTLVFTRTEDVECGRTVKVPGVEGPTELPVGKPIAIALTMPADGELVFTCGMDMFRGVVTIKPKA